MKEKRVDSKAGDSFLYVSLVGIGFSRTNSLVTEGRRKKSVIHFLVHERGDLYLECCTLKKRVSQNQTALPTFPYVRQFMTGALVKTVSDLYAESLIRWCQSDVSCLVRLGIPKQCVVGVFVSGQQRSQCMGMKACFLEMKENFLERCQTDYSAIPCSRGGSFVKLVGQCHH